MELPSRDQAETNPKPSSFSRTRSSGASPDPQGSAELKGPRNLLRIRPENLDFQSDLGLKVGQTKPEISGTAPTARHTTLRNDSGPIPTCLDDDPKLLNCEIAPPRPRGGPGAPNLFEKLRSSTSPPLPSRFIGGGDFRIPNCHEIVLEIGLRG